MLQESNNNSAKVPYDRVFNFLEEIVPFFLEELKKLPLPIGDRYN